MLRINREVKAGFSRRFVSAAVAVLMAGVLVVGLSTVGCKKDDETKTSGGGGASAGGAGGGATTRPTGPSNSGTGATSAVAVIAPAKAAATQESNKVVMGTVTFTKAAGGVKVVADLTGLSPGKHGIHIHQNADLSAPTLASAGGHFNPDMHKHGGPDTAEHHAGDLGNITADADGKAHLDMTMSGLTIGDGSKTDVIGHSVVVHAGEDDMKSDPAGNSGGRVAAGVIEGKK